MASNTLTDVLQAPRRRFRPYPKYRDSGVEGLGDIPAHWQVKRLKTIARVQLSNVDKKSIEGDVPVRLCNYVDVYYNDHITSSIEFMSATATAEQRTRFSLRRGDVLITKDSESWTDIAVPAVVAEDLDDVVCGYHLAHIRPLGQLDGRFLARAFSAVGPRDQFQIAANGITRFGLSRDAIKDALFAVPPLPEQLAIAAFLDRETTKIDALVAKKVRVIELLQEKRIALITQAATKGLDLNAPMKDSGIEWLGEIPGHWEIKRLPQLVHIQEGPGIMASDFTDEGVPLLRIANLTGGAVKLDGCDYLAPEAVARKWSHFKVRSGDLLISGSASMGLASVFDSEATGAIPYTGIFCLRPMSEEVVREFIRYFVTSKAFLDQVNTLKTGVGVQHYGPTHLRRVYAPSLPSPEQRRIALFLDQETGRIDALGRRIRNGIDCLEEFRAALISAAVTGKIDVREGSG